MGTYAQTDAGVVRFVCSYRNTATYSVGGRRFEAGWADERGADGLTLPVYYCRDEADAAALVAYLEAQDVELEQWCRARGWLSCVRPWSVLVDPARWERIVYPNAGEGGWLYQLAGELEAVAS